MSVSPSPVPPLRVGVAGSGPWAQLFHAPMFAAHPATHLTAVWGRRLSAAEAVAGPLGATACDSFARFLDQVDAVAFAVPPDVQCVLATEAARAGKALLLEKPVAVELDHAEALGRVVDEAGTPTQMVLTWRYAAGVRAFLEQVARSTPIGGRAHFLTGGLLGGIFATPWRIAHGPLLDLGPHVVDLLDAALGPVVGIRAHGDPFGWVGLLLDHADGVVSEASLTAVSGFRSARAGIEVHTTGEVLEITTTGVSSSVTTTLVDEFVATARDGIPHPLDIHRGLHLQRLLATAALDLRAAGPGAG